jgi:DNA-binding LytR/AlgR family response regulator
MISCVAIDDEPLALVIVQELCRSVDYLDLQRTFTDTAEAAKYLRKFPVDLLFLDIQMPDQNGIDFYRQHGNDKPVVFTTAFSEYAVEGFNVNAVDYLLKPVEPGRFIKAADKARDYINYLQASGNERGAHLYVRSEYNLVKIPFNEILYIETLDDYIKIHMSGRKPVLSKMNLKNVLSKLGTDFIRVHRSFIVPLSKIVSVRNKTISIGNTDIPIGVKFEHEFFQRFAPRD